MAYAQVNREIFTHLKTLQAARALRLQPVHFVGHLAALWAWCTESAPDGDLSDCKPIDIAFGACFKGCSNRFVTVLIECGWLVKTSTGLCINDWNKHTGKFLQQTEKAKKRQQRFKEKNVSATFEKRFENVLETFEQRFQNVSTPPHIRLDQIRSDHTNTDALKSILDFEQAQTANDPERQEEATDSASEGGQQLQPTLRDSQNGLQGAVATQPDVAPTPDPNRARKQQKNAKSEGVLTPARIRDLWNAGKAPNQPLCATMSPDRVKHAIARIKEFPNEETWIQAVASTASSDFYRGINDSGWVASFDWLISPKGRKALEGGLGTRGVRRNSLGGIDSRDLGARPDDSDDYVERLFEEGSVAKMKEKSNAANSKTSIK